MQSKIEGQGGNKSSDLTEAQRGLPRTRDKRLSLQPVRLGYFPGVELG